MRNNELIICMLPYSIQLKQMEIEVTSIPPSYKATVNNRVRNAQISNIIWPIGQNLQK